MNGLAVTALSLAHFRSHKRVRLRLDGRPVALFGPNGAGKTNVLEAISLLSPGRGLRRASAGDFAKRPEGLGWRVSAELRGLEGGHEVETGAEGEESRFVRIDGKSAPQARLGRLCRVLWLVPSMDRLWLEGAEGRRRFLDRMTMSFVPEHAEAVLSYEKAMRERNRLLRDQIADAHWYGAIEAQMAASAEGITANRAFALARLQSAQEGDASSFPRADLSLAAPERAPEELASHWAASRLRDMAAGRTLSGPHRVDLAARYAAKDMAADQCSTGEQKALLISLLLANARALAEDLGRAPVVLLDEVAAHLDQDRRAALYDEICRLGAQAIMTGTEAALFESLGARGQSFSLAEGQVEEIP